MGSSPPPTDNVASAVGGGFAKRRNEIFGEFAFLTLVYVVVYYAAPVILPSDALRPAAQFCPDEKESNDNEEECTRPDLFAFQVAATFAQLYLGLGGVLGWRRLNSNSNDKHAADSASMTTPERRLFSRIESAEHLLCAIVAFQMWDFTISLGIPEHATVIFLGHHLAAALTAFYALEYGLVQYYSVFFGGCSEFSSIFLVVCDFDVYFPSEAGTTFGTLVFACQALFTLFFFYYRLIGWWMVSVPLWSDVRYVLREGKVKVHRPGRETFLYVFLVMNVMLGALQMYWFGLGIMPKVMEVLSS